MQHHGDMETSHRTILDLAAQRGLIRPRDLNALGLPSAALTRLVRQGLLTRVGRGLYARPDRSVSEHGTLAEVARKHPQAIVCLLSALRVHDLTTQSPFEVWLAITNKARAPKMDYPPLRIVRFSGAALTDGIEEHQIDGVTVRVTNVARTVADCFKFRNKIGLDVAMEALQEAWRAKRVSMDEIWRYATLCRVANVMRPYMGGLTVWQGDQLAAVAAFDLDRHGQCQPPVAGLQDVRLAGFLDADIAHASASADWMVDSQQPAELRLRTFNSRLVRGATPPPTLTQELD